MSQERLGVRVGAFVFVGLVVLALLLVNFSRGTRLFAHTYPIRMRTANVGGIIPGAKVLMAGVPVGRVARVVLNPGGQSVEVFLSIYDQYQIHTNAQFTIEQAGFLGDQYVSIIPGERSRAVLAPGAEVHSQEPFNLQEAARSTLGLIKRIDQTVSVLNDSVRRVDRVLLTEATLTNLSQTVRNFRVISDHAKMAVEQVGQLIKTNGPDLGVVLSNLVSFTDQLNQLAAEFQGVVATNRNELAGAIEHLERSTGRVDHLLDGLENGKGLAGSLLQDEKVKTQFRQVISNLTLLSDNLTRYGLFWKPASARVKPLPTQYTGKSPFH